MFVRSFVVLYFAIYFFMCCPIFLYIDLVYLAIVLSVYLPIWLCLSIFLSASLFCVFVQRYVCLLFCFVFSVLSLFFLVLPFFLSFLLPSFLPLILGDDSNRSQSINQSIRLSTVFLPFSLWFCPCLYIINFFPTYLSTYFRNCPLWTNFEQVTWATRFWSQKRVSSSLFTNSKNWFKKETNTQNQEENC